MISKRIGLQLCLSFLFFSGFAHAVDLNFPVDAGKQQMVTTLRWSDEKYDIYLPSTYSATSNPLPLIFTMDPGGGGLVSNFKTVAEEKQVIVVGLLDNKNSTPYSEIYPNNSAVFRDVMERINYDPTALYTAGFSGGAVGAYEFTKFYRPHVTGVFAMGGWLANRHNSYDRFRSGLLVARANGNNDTGANYYLGVDANHLSSYGVIINDYSFSGGHQQAPDSTKRLVIDWLLSNRSLPAAGAQVAADNAAAAWRQRIEQGDDEAVLIECVDVLLSDQSSYLAREAQLIVWDLMDNYERFATYDLVGAFSGAYASDFFWGIAYGPGYLGELNVYNSAAYAAEYVSAPGASSYFDFPLLFSEVGYPPPFARFTASSPYGASLREVDFDAAESIAPWQTISQYDWDFGDGNIASGMTATHSFPGEGMYPVTLTVTASDLQHTHTESVIIGIPPVIESVSSSVNQLPIQDGLGLECVATHARGDLLTYQWAVVSGPGVLYPTVLEDDGSRILAHFSRPGIYRVSVHVSNGPIEISSSVEVEVLSDQRDFDDDGIVNSDEDYNHNGIVDSGESAPMHPDIDLDGLWDKEERLWGTNPLVEDDVFQLSRDGSGVRVWSIDFESRSGGYRSGAIDGKYAWYDESRLSLVESTSGVGGSQGVTLPSHSGGTELFSYWALQRSQSVTVEFDGKLTPGALPDVYGLEPTAALFKVNEDGFVCGYNGTVSAWIQSSTQVASETWHTYIVDLDYNTKRWGLRVDGNTVFADLGFFDTTLERLSRISFEQLPDSGGSEGALDNLSVSTASPMDAWLASYFDDHLAIDAQPLADADGDGGSNLLEFSQGGNPLVSDREKWSPMMSKESGNLQFRFRQDGLELDYFVESSVDLAIDGWAPVFDGIAPEGDGVFSVTVPNISESPVRFYRLKVLNYAE